MMKYFTLAYSGAKLDYRINLGDEIQSVAAARLLPRVDGAVSREKLNMVSEPCIVSMNGFFMDSPNWPPTDKVVPIPFAFHISKKYEKHICSEAGLAYLKRFEPIGCRDRATHQILEKRGVEAYYSKCLTLTLDKRAVAPDRGKVYVVGVTSALQKVIPEELLNDAVFVNQSKVQLPNFSPELKRQMAQELLEDYKQNASLVITSRIHCAMPCIAMGIPVVFLFSKQRRDDYRVHIIEDIIGIHYIDERFLFLKPVRNYYKKAINWNPGVKDIEAEKQVIKTQYKAAIGRAEKNYARLFS